MIIKVKVKPNSLRDSIERVSDIEYIVHVKAPAEDNKANIRVTNMLARHFGVNVGKIRIKNPRSRNKIIEII